MSHFTRIRTQLVDKEYLCQALADLGYAVEEGSVEVRGYNGSRARVELKVATGSPGYDIGFGRSGGTYELVADWWGITDVSRDQLLQRLMQRYVYRATLAKLTEQGFTLARDDVEDGERVHLVLRRMA